MYAWIYVRIVRPCVVAVPGGVWWLRHILSLIYTRVAEWWLRHIVSNIYQSGGVWWLRHIVTNIYQSGGVWWLRHIVTNIYQSGGVVAEAYCHRVAECGG